MQHLDPKVLWMFLAEILGAAVLCTAVIVRRRIAGPMLLDLGSIQPWGIGSMTSPRARLALGIAMLVLGVFDTFVIPTKFTGLAFVFCGEFTILIASRKVQIRQNGILLGKLMRWDEIREYEVSPRGFLRLRLVDGLWRRFDVEIPEALQPHVRRLFEPRVRSHEARIVERESFRSYDRIVKF
jgi:hypothetical protein